MIRRSITLIIIASVVSAGLLFLGLAVLGQYSTANATSLDALVAKTSVQNSSNAIPAGNSSLVMEAGKSKESSKVPSPSKAVPAAPVASDLLLPMPVSAINTAAADNSVNISQLLTQPNQYFNQVISITGIATSLGKDKFLLNDGTGQILVAVEDDLVGFAFTDGKPITVIGKLDDSSNQSGFVFDAHTLSNENGNAVSDDCADDDASTGDGDCIDDIDDDCLDDNDENSDDDAVDNPVDDSEDDSNEDCANDDCADDDSEDDSSDDSEDDSSDDSEDDSSDDSEDDSSDDSDDDGEDD